MTVTCDKYKDHRFIQVNTTIWICDKCHFVEDLTAQAMQRRLWRRLTRKLDSIQLAARIYKLQSYKKFMQRYPFDGSEQPLSLDYVIPNAQGEEGTTSVVDVLPDERAGMEEVYTSAEFNSEFKSTLTKRQLRVLELLEQGYRPKDIYEQLGYKNTGGVRYIKWAIRQKYNSFKAQQVT